MKRQTTAVMLLKLLAGLSLFTGIIAIIFVTFLFVNLQTKKVSITPTPTQSLSPTKPPTREGKFCGGIAGIRCPAGYTCKLSGTYPDAGGTCIQQGN